MSHAEIQPLPATRANALSVLQRQDSSTHEIAMLVETDPSLTAAVLRAANSVVQIAMDPPTTAQEAVVRLGLDETRRLITGFVLDTAFDGIGHAGIDTAELWRHLIAVALLADAAAVHEDRRTEAFTAGLLHDVGRMAMATFDPDRYRRVVEVARQGIDTCRAEFLLFGADHADWGVRVGWEWGLPARVVGSIADHHDGAAVGQPLARAVAVGRETTERLGIGDGVVSVAASTADGPDRLLPADHELLQGFGGAAGFLQRVDAYQAAIAS